MENIKTVLTTLVGGIVSFANFKLMSISVTEQMEVANGVIGILVGLLTMAYLMIKITKTNEKDK
jgi:hypothetical protein